MGLKCKSCGEDSVNLEDNGSGEQQLCRSCGVVYSDCALVLDRGALMKKSRTHDNFFPENLPKQYARYQFPTRSKSYYSCRKLILTLSSALRLKKSYTDESLDMFDQVFDLYKTCQRETKLCLASWCVYIVCRQGGLPITSRYISQLSGYPIHKVYQYHSELLEKLGITLIHQDITELIECTLKTELAKGIVCSHVIQEKTKDIILLCKDLWLIEGRNPQASIVSAFFIAWQSEDFAARRKANLTKICNKKVLMNSCSKRLREFKTTLCKLASCIPWVTGIRAENLAYYIDDVLKYQKSLVIDVLRKARIESDSSGDQKRNSDVFQGDSFLRQATMVANEADAQIDISEKGFKTSIPHCVKTESPSLGLCGRESSQIVDSGTGEDNQSCGGNLNNLPTKERSSDRCCKDREKRKQNMELECIFTPPAFKKARRKSIDCDTIQEYIACKRVDNSARSPSQ